MTYHAHLAQVDDRAGLIFMASCFTLTTILAVAFRFYSRSLTRAGFGHDDWLALTAMVFVLALNGTFIGGTAQGAITGHSPVVDNWPVSTDLEHLVEKYKYGFQTTEKITFGIIKLSILFLWKRIFGNVRPFRIFCHVMMGVVAAWSISFFFATLFQCGTHWDWNWAPIGIFLTQCTNTLNMLTVFTATDLFTDFIIMFMPVPMIWRLHMPTRKKVGITSIFMVGLFTIGAGIARMYIYLTTSYDKEDNPDFIADFTLFILWSEIEANVAMIVCCMPTFAPVLGVFRNGLVSITNSTRLSKRGLLSFDRPSTKGSTKTAEMPIFSQTESAQVRYSPNEVSWEEGDGAATAAAFAADLEEGLKRNHGIVARTEISSTIEKREG